MQRRSFTVIAHWDEEEKIWFSESDLDGLHIEADTFEEFQSLVEEFAAELIVANHYSEEILGSKSLSELIPAIVIKMQGHEKRAS